MYKFKEDIARVVELGRIEDMHCLSMLLEESVKELKDCNPEFYRKAKTKVYEMAHGKVLSEDMAHDWVKHMEPVGQKWSITETTDVLHKYNLHFNEIQWYTVMNMMANDFSDIVSTNLDLTVRLAKDWLNDSDAVEDKLYCYYKHIVK